MVSTYPPTPCGIGAYGEQSVARLRADGHVVDVLSPDGGGKVDFAWHLRGGFKLLRLFKLLPYYDRVILQYHPAFYYLHPNERAYRWNTLKTTLSFTLFFLCARNLEVVAHEIPYIRGKQGWLYKWQWKLVRRLVLPTRQERGQFERFYHLRLQDSRVEIRPLDEV